MCKRGDIYFVDFGQDTSSFKQCGIRPAIVVSNNRANTHSPVVTVVPLTSRVHKKRSMPTHVLIPRSARCGLKRSSLALAEQVESLDKTKLLDYKGTITDEKLMGQITRALQIQIGAVGSYD